MTRYFLIPNPANPAAKTNAGFWLVDSWSCVVSRPIRSAGFAAGFVILVKHFETSSICSKSIPSVSLFIKVIVLIVSSLYSCSFKAFFREEGGGGRLVWGDPESPFISSFLSSKTQISSFLTCQKSPLQTNAHLHLYLNHQISRIWSSKSQAKIDQISRLQESHTPL